MATHAVPQPTIIGNVPVESVAVNAKGGSVAAILKKSIRGDLADLSICYGAKMEFEPGVSCVFVAPGEIAQARGSEARKFRVKRVSPRRYIIDLDHEEAEMIDPLTQAMLHILERQLKDGQMKLLTDDQVTGRLSELEQAGDRVVARARRRVNKP
jgi:hypothetical protein